MTPKARGWLTPSAIPDGHLYRVISIPNNPDFVQAVNGAIYELALSYNWQKSGTLSPEECQEQMMTMFLSYLEGGFVYPIGYIKGLRLFVDKVSGAAAVRLEAGECRDASNLHDISSPTELTYTPIGLAVNTWYKAILKKNLTTGAVTLSVETASYYPSAGERFVGWLKTSLNSTVQLVRMSTIGSGNMRKAVIAEAVTNASTSAFVAWLSDFVATTYTTIDLSNYVPPNAQSAHCLFRGDAPNILVTLRWRPFGNTTGTIPTIGTFATGSPYDEARVEIPLVSGKFDLYASGAGGKDWLGAGVEAYTYEL